MNNVPEQYGSRCFSGRRKGFLEPLIIYLIFVTSSPFIFYFLLIYSLTRSSEDKFADKLTIPDNIIISEPLDEAEKSLGGPDDTFQIRLLSTLKNPGNEDTSITALIPLLVKLQENTPDVLLRYLASSPSWRVFKERGSIFATRRWMIGSRWLYEMHGYYTDFDLKAPFVSNLPNFQTRLILGFSGRPWARLSRESTSINHGQTKNLTISGSNGVLRSHCVITTNELVIEIFEQSNARERRLTKASLMHIEDELHPLFIAPEFQTILSMLPPNAIRYGKPTFDLRNSSQPGIYDSEIWINPGEPGMIYLKACEITKGTNLSVNELKRYANEFVGWSDDPSQLFFSNTHFTIYEGDWGKPFAARFEVWFVPDSGEPERKLIEKIFKIEGWQR